MTWLTGVRFLAWAKIPFCFFLPPIKWVPRSFLSEVSLSGHEGNLSPSSRVEVKNAWKYGFWSVQHSLPCVYFICSFSNCRQAISPLQLSSYLPSREEWNLEERIRKLWTGLSDVAAVARTTEAETNSYWPVFSFILHLKLLYFLACFPYIEKHIVGLWDHVAVCVSLLSLLGSGSVNIPLSSLGNGSVKIPLSLLGNDSVKIPLSLLGDGSVG
jgi:hypothetical protein